MLKLLSLPFTEMEGSQRETFILKRIYGGAGRRLLPGSFGHTRTGLWLRMARSHTYERG
ncbi:hypothetical protein OKW36_006414 [Paraburkholderia sp. MM5482-R1]